MIPILLFPQKELSFRCNLMVAMQREFLIDAKYHVIRYYVPLQA